MEVAEDNLKRAIDILGDLQEDNLVSRNIKQKVTVMRSELEKSNNQDLSLKINKMLSDLEEISADVNLPLFVRTQVWHLTSILEKMA